MENLASRFRICEATLAGVGAVSQKPKKHNTLPHRLYSYAPRERIGIKTGIIGLLIGSATGTNGQWLPSALLSLRTLTGGIEIFGALRLKLKPMSESRYANVYKVKKGWQAKVWDKARQTLINLGTFETPRDAAVAVAETHLTGIASVPSPDKSRMKRGSGGRALPRPRPSPFCIQLSDCCHSTHASAQVRRRSQRKRSAWGPRARSRSRVSC